MAAGLIKTENVEERSKYRNVQEIKERTVTRIRIADRVNIKNDSPFLETDV